MCIPIDGKSLCLCAGSFFIDTLVSCDYNKIQ